MEGTSEGDMGLAMFAEWCGHESSEHWGRGKFIPGTRANKRDEDRFTAFHRAREGNARARVWGIGDVRERSGRRQAGDVQ